MEDRPDGACAVGLSYLGGARVVPHYGGGMSTAKAALEIDAKQLAQQRRAEEGSRTTSSPPGRTRRAPPAPSATSRT